MRKLLYCLCGLMLLTSTGWAISDMEPASILVYPYFHTEKAKESIITVTNVNPLRIYDPQTDTLFGDVFVKFYYVDGEDCSISDREALMTPADTFTVLASDHNPAMNYGWLYVVAIDPWSKLVAIKYDGQIVLSPELIFNSGLIGDILVVDGQQNFMWAIPAIGIKACEKITWKQPADGNFNGILEFGNEYEGLPSALFISSFIEVGVLNSEAYLILLTFDLENEVDLDFLFYNNNEEEFSQEWSFECWAYEKLVDIFKGADNLEGLSTDYDDSAPFSTGWASIVVDGDVETRFTTPILGVIIQKIVGGQYQAAHLLHHSQDDYVYGYLEY